MAFFDDFGKKISNLGQTAVQKTRGVTDIARLNSAVNDEEKKLNNTYREIGKIYVRLHLNDPEPSLVDYVRAAAEGEQRIAVYHQQIQETRGTVRCPSCGGQVTANSAFCNNCGFKLLQPQFAPQGNGTLCPQCGNVLAPSMKFCNICGFKLDPPPMNGSTVPPIKPPVNGNPIPPINPPMNGNPIPPNNINCPKCGKSVDGNLKFCTMCGTKFDKAEPIPSVPPVPPTPDILPKPPRSEGKSLFARPDKPSEKEIAPSDIIREKGEKSENTNNKIICSNCGADMDSGLKFCTVCGTKLEPNTPPKPEDKPPFDKPTEVPKGFLDKKPNDLTKPEDKPPFDKPIEAPKGFLDKKPEVPPKPNDESRTAFAFAEKPKKRPDEPPKPPVSDIKCPSCGANIKSDLKFCIKCGTKLPPSIGDKPPFVSEPPKSENKSPFAPIPPKPEEKSPFDKPIEAPKGLLDKKPEVPTKPNDESRTAFAFAEKPKKKPDEPPKPPVSDIKCPSCGANIKSDLKFCIKCGTKLPPPIDNKPPFVPEPPKPENKSPFAPIPPKQDDKPPIPPKKEDEFKTTFALSETAKEFLEKKPELPLIPKADDKPPFAPIPPKPEEKSPFGKSPVPLTPPKPVDNSKRPSEVPPKPSVSDVKCPSCGSPVKPGVKFCIVCGAKLSSPVNDKPPFPPKSEEKPPKPIDKSDEAQGTVCSNCNAKMNPGLKFCTACGAKLDEFFSIAKSNSDKNKITPPKQSEDMLTIAKAGIVLPAVPQSPSPAGVKRCHKCNSLVDSSVRFCTECGTPMDGSMPNPPASMPNPMGNVPFGKKKCKNCSAVLDADMRFCTSCGFALDDTPQNQISGLGSSTVYAGSSSDMYEDYNQPTTVLSGNMFSNDDYSQPTTVLSGSPFGEEEDFAPTINLDGQMCPNCKSVMASDMLFCTECGTRL